jgi:hypothetical protein
VVLLLPLDEATDVSIKPTFSWEMGAATLTHYRLEVSTSDGFMPLTIERTITHPLSNYTVIETPLSFGTRYYWRVIAISGTDESFGNTVRYFHTESAPPNFSINPEYHDFGSVEIGQTSSPVTFAITNDGGEDLIVSSIVSTDAQFLLSNPNEMPVSVPAGETAVFMAYFKPINTGVQTGDILLTHNVSETPFAVQLSGESTVSDEDVVEIPRVTGLIGNFPNPFNPSTRLEFGVRSSEFGSVSVHIEVFDIRGRLVRTLLDGSLEFGYGRHSVVWDGRDDGGLAVSSGIYLYRMIAGEYVSVRRMVLMK